MTLGLHDRREDQREIAEQAIVERDQLAQAIAFAGAEFDDPRIKYVSLQVIREDYELAKLIVKRESL